MTNSDAVDYKQIIMEMINGNIPELEDIPKDRVAHLAIYSMLDYHSELSDTQTTDFTTALDTILDDASEDPKTLSKLITFARIKPIWAVHETVLGLRNKISDIPDYLKQEIEMYHTYATAPPAIRENIEKRGKRRLGHGFLSV